MNPIHNQDFLNWLENRRRKKRLEKKLEKRQQKFQNKKKNYRYKKKQNRIWCIIKKRFNIQTGNPPPYPIKDWFFN